MNKKQMMVAAIAAVLSVSSANATNITGATGTNGVFNINPTQVSGDVGYRHYHDFTLSEGDIANLIYQGMKNGESRDINSFINLVQNKIDVNGVINTMRGGNFYNGHAIFISPNGMTVGASGVLNVGQLSVITPTQDKFDNLTTAFNTYDYATLNKVSKLRSTEAVNYGGNAAVNIAGTILARKGVDIRGSEVNISGGILNGIENTDAFTDKAKAATQAKELFDSLVNTTGINTDTTNIIIKSGKGTTSTITIADSAKIANHSNGEVSITNHGDAGLSIAGNVASGGKLNVYNNNASSDLAITGAVGSKGAMSVSNSGKALNIDSAATLASDGTMQLVNNGSGTFTLAGKALAKGKTDVINRSTEGMDITGTVGNTSTSSVRIVNYNGKLTFTGNANADKSVSVRNAGTGVDVGGTIKAGEGILVQNTKGAAKVSGNLTVDNGDIAILNEGTGKLTVASTAKLNNTLGNVAIKNASTGGMEFNGTITNEGEVAINNTAGSAVVNGTITNIGNTGIINKENGTGITIGATINNEGTLKLVNSTGTNGLTIGGTVTNASGDLYVYNDAGTATINGTLNNTEAGNLYVLSRNNSNGLTTGADSVIANEAGTLVIKHNGANATVGSDAKAGMDLNGTITNSGETAINNYKGDMLVNGTISTESGNLGIINRATGATMNMDATVTHDGTNYTTNIKNYGTGDMNVNGEITHNGRLNVLANTNKLNLNGKIHNNGKDMTYTAARDKGTGIAVGEEFAADTTNGNILIKNITGDEGLTFNGSITSTNKQAEVYNKKGDMTVSGTISGHPAVVLSTGNNMTVTNDANLQGDIQIINKGSKSGTVADKYKSYYRERLDH